MNQIDFYMSKYYRAQIDERLREIALYKSGVRTLEGRNGYLVDVTDETVTRLQEECDWYDKLLAYREHRAS
jgi:hypothetical protein